MYILKVGETSRSVAILTEENYLVIIQIIRDLKSKFTTAYVADSPRRANSIRKNPK